MHKYTLILAIIIALIEFSSEEHWDPDLYNSYDAPNYYQQPHDTGYGYGGGGGYQERQDGPAGGPPGGPPAGAAGGGPPGAPAGTPPGPPPGPAPSFAQPLTEGDYDYKDTYLNNKAGVVAGTLIWTYLLGFSVLAGTIILASIQATAGGVGRRKRSIETENENNWLGVLEKISTCSAKYLCESDKDFDGQMKSFVEGSEVEDLLIQKKISLLKTLKPNNCDKTHEGCPVNVGFYIRAARFIQKMLGYS